MQLSIKVPSEWPIVEVGDQRVAKVGSDVVLAWGWLVPLPDDRNAWMTRALRVDVGTDATIQVSANEARRTRTGWPFTLLEAEVHVAGAAAEYRVGAFYELFEYGAVALARAKSRAAVDAVRERIIAALETAAPAWQADGLVVCVHDLFRS